MASMVRDGAISPVELVDAHLAQIAARNPEINAFVMVLGEEARERARALERGDQRGLLYGVPITVKDSFDMAGIPSRVGSPGRPLTPAARDATAVARLLAEGAIVLGRTNTPEMLARYDTDNPITGRTNNPWDLERTPGGSSGGEAAAIAAYCSPGGVASDGGGSIRMPAHFCGIAGLKPTPGRISGTGHTPSLGHPAGLVTTVGPMARGAKDLRLLFSVLCGYDGQDPFSVPVPLREASAEQVRIGVWEQFYAVPVEPEIRAAVRRAAELASALGFAVDAFEPRGLERAPNLWSFFFGQWIAKGSALTAEEALNNLAARDRMRAALLRQMEGVAAVLMPVFGIAAFRHGESKWLVEGKEIGLFQAAMPAVVANALGLPAVTVPIAVTEGGIPVGVQLMGRPFEDEWLLELAIRLEEARGPWLGPAAFAR
jgi:Asp-tRNA(Asn)/Glu-tRNA(Gln) amidotransferase A subunit family amidase